jgi:muramoyltetrapeptide carboxypeptidase LdcA involved in peptidoglycan recycling
MSRGGSPKNAEILEEFDSAPVAARVSDLREAFSDPNVEGMLTTLGGYNSNQLLRSLDYSLIRDNPKVLCGFSDITALATAIHTKTDLVTYSGPHYPTFAMKRGIEYTLAHFERCLMQEGPYEVGPADHWSDDPWYADQENREFVPNSGYEVLNEGEAEGTLLGGHLGTLLLLCGTPYRPDLAGSLLLLECDEEIRPEHLDRSSSRWPISRTSRRCGASCSRSSRRRREWTRGRSRPSSEANPSSPGYP